MRCREEERVGVRVAVRDEAVEAPDLQSEQRREGAVCDVQQRKKHQELRQASER